MRGRFERSEHTRPNRAGSSCVPRRGRSGGGGEAEGAFEVGGDGVEGLLAVDEEEAVGGGAAVVVDDRAGAFVVDGLADVENLGGVVGAAGEGGAVVVADAFDLGRIVGEMIGGAAGRADAAAGHATEGLLGGDGNLDVTVDGETDGLLQTIEQGNLAEGSGEAVEQEAIVAEGGEVAGEDLVGEIIGHELAGFQERFDLPAERIPLADGVAEQRSGADHGEAVGLAETLGNAALAAAGTAKGDNVEGEISGHRTSRGRKPGDDRSRPGKGPRHRGKRSILTESGSPSRRMLRSGNSEG